MKHTTLTTSHRTASTLLERLADTDDLFAELAGITASMPRLARILDARSRVDRVGVDLQ